MKIVCYTAFIWSDERNCPGQPARIPGEYVGSANSHHFQAAENQAVGRARLEQVIPQAFMIGTVAVRINFVTQLDRPAGARDIQPLTSNVEITGIEVFHA